VTSKQDRAAGVTAYKGVLKRVVDNRPSGTRHRLALALGKNRSFISQITSPAYSVPIPPGHLETIFEICHFTPTEKSEFLAAYAQAHKHRPGLERKRSGSRRLTLTVPDLGDSRRNRLLAEALEAMVPLLARLAEENGRPS
jgi:hypothetical protein